MGKKDIMETVDETIECICKKIQNEELQTVNSAAQNGYPLEDITDICKPVINYLNKNCDPYTEIHISQDEIKITYAKCGIPV